MNESQMMDERTDQIWWSRFRRTKLGIAAQIALVIAVFLLGLMLGGGDEKTPSAGLSQNDRTSEVAEEPTVWTCSMHPQIQLPKPGKCPICFMDLIPVESGGGEGLDPNQIKLSETARQLARIETTPVRRADAKAAIRLVGQIEYDETSLAYITAWVPGRIDSLYADFTGVTVRKGEPLVSLYSPHLLSAQQELLQAKKSLAAMESAGGVLRSTAQATVDAAREKLRLWGLTAEQIERIEAEGEPTDHLTITAPVGGIVIEKEARQGQYVETGARIYTVADLSRLWVVLEAYESDLPWLREGQEITFTSPSFPGETFTATISFIDPVIDRTSRTARVRAIVENDRGRLKPDMFVSAVVQSQLDIGGGVVQPGAAQAAETDSPLLIPASAPLLTGKRAIVYVQVADDDGPVFEGREVQLGPRSGDYYIVAEGLSEGEEVVTRGAFKIDAELQIQAKPSMMSLARPGTDDQIKPGRESSAVSLTEVSETARAALTPLYTAYFTTQMALANDQFDEAREGMSEVSDKIAAVDMSLFEGDARERWMELSRRMQTAAEAGAEASDIETVRAAFRDLSNAAIELHETFGHADDEEFYLAYCPMAFNNAGAFWLQTEGIIWNSYWGEAMLRCGEIRDTLPPPSTQNTPDPAPQPEHVH